MRPHSLLSGAPRQSHTQQIFQHRLVAPQGHTPQVQVKVERSVETNVVENKGSQGGAHLQGRDSWTLPPRASSGPGAAQPGPVLTGRAQDEREHREAGARAGLVGLLLSHGRRVAAQEIWGHSPRSQGRSSCHGWTHVDRAASSPWWVTPTHPRPCSHVSLTQKVSGRACQDPSSPAPRVGGGALEAIIQPPAATKASRLRPSTQQPRPEIQPHACSPSCVGAQHCVLRGGLWSLQGWALGNLSPNLSSLQQRSEEKSPYGGGCQSQSPPRPGPWVWPHQWAPHLPCVQSQNTGVRGLQTGRVPLGPWSSAAQWMNPEGTGLSDGIVTTQ